MAWHYHSWACPHCGQAEQVGCNLSNCNQEAQVSKEPFTRAGYKAQVVYCICGDKYYCDTGAHKPIARKETPDDALPVQFPKGRSVLFKNPK